MWQKNKLLVEKVILQVQLEYKVFQKYENVWPVHDLLVQYLCNSSQKEKKAATKFQKWTVQMKKVMQASEGVQTIDEWTQRAKVMTIPGHRRANMTFAPRSGPGMNEMIDEWTQMAKVTIPSHQRANTTLAPGSDPGTNQMIDKWTQTVKSRLTKTLGHSSDSDSESDKDPRPLKSRPVKTLAHSSEGESDEDPRPLKSRPAKMLGCSSGKHNSCPQKGPRDESNDRRVDSNGESDDPQPSKSRLTKAPVADDDKLANNSDEDDPQPLKSRPTKTPVANDNKLANDSNEDDPSPGNIFPKICPGMDCQDTIPDHPSEQLKTALSMHVGLIKAKKPNIQLATNICILIK
ncbi:hypothetical protein EDC04DRAFT_2615532 [Pisolithus marmoratus]|nr:hypothetical protein EDC04DRAFT_2615532 [Pisolithus marmoratus]